MDALALLCTLHAEGPTTAKRLRQAGCVTLERVLALEASALASLLCAPSAVARRFQREARSLLDRLGAEHLEPSPEHVRALDALQPSDQRLAERVVAEWKEQRASGEPASPMVVRLEPASQASSSPPVDALYPVLNSARWNDSTPSDGASASVQRMGLATDESLDAHTNASRELVPLAPNDLGLDRREVPAALAAFAVDGLNAEAVQALALAGVRDLAELAACDALALARASGLAYPRIVRWRALAARACPPAGPKRAACQSLVIERATPPEVVGATPSSRVAGVGGPFA